MVSNVIGSSSSFTESKSTQSTCSRIAVEVLESPHHAHTSSQCSHNYLKDSPHKLLVLSTITLAIDTGHKALMPGVSLVRLSMAGTLS